MEKAKAEVSHLVTVGGPSVLPSSTRKNRPHTCKRQPELMLGQQDQSMPYTTDGLHIAVRPFRSCIRPGNKPARDQTRP